MATIKLPPIVPAQEYTKFSPLEREKYIHNIVKEISKLNPQGVTASVIERNTSISRRVVEKHLEILVATNEAYKVNFGNSIVYYPNERSMHPIHTEELKVNGKKIGLYIVENLFGKFLFIQEKKQQEYGSEIMGGIMIPIEKLEDFVDFVTKSVEKLKEKGN